MIKYHNGNIIMIKYTMVYIVACFTYFYAHTLFGGGVIKIYETFTLT